MHEISSCDSPKPAHEGGEDRKKLQLMTQWSNNKRRRRQPAYEREMTPRQSASKHIPSQWTGAAAPSLSRLLPLPLPALTQMSSKLLPLPKIPEPQE